MTQTAQAPIQDITSSEAEAAQKVENVKKESTKEVESFKASEEGRLENRKSEIKQGAQQSLKEEESKLQEILKEGGVETKKQKDALSANCKKNEPGIVTWLTEQFLKIAP